MFGGQQMAGIASQAPSSVLLAFYKKWGKRSNQFPVEMLM
jgi:hypothetical protein